MTAPAIEARAVVVELGGARILHGVDLDVAPGEWVAVIGPNGAGKSTLLRAVGGLLAAQSGSISIFGTAMQRLKRRERARQVATVPQAPVVPPGIGVLDYVLLGRTPYIAPLGRESARDLAAVLLLDEPTTALDIGHQQDVLELVDELRRDRGLTVVSTMHELSIAGEYAERMVLLAHGRVAAAGPPAEVLTEPLLAQHYGARVRVLEGDHGPLVVPVRPPANPSR